MNDNELTEEQLYNSISNEYTTPQYSCTKITRLRSAIFNETGVTTGCYSLQQFIMIRIALYSLFPYLFDSEYQKTFIKNERIIYICLTNNWQIIDNDIKEFPKDLKKNSTVENYIRSKSKNSEESDELINKIQEIKKITNTVSRVNMYYNFNEDSKNPLYNNDYNLKSLKNVDESDCRQYITPSRVSNAQSASFSPLRNAHCVGVLNKKRCNEYIANSFNYPIPMAFGYKFQITNRFSNFDQLAIDHWFVIWKGKIHTAWGDDMFGFKYFKSPEITADYFCELLLFLKNMELPDMELPDLTKSPISRSQFDFINFMKNYMGINEKTVIIYDTYKTYYKNTLGKNYNETRLKTQVVDNLINSYLKDHDFLEYDEDKIYKTSKKPPRFVMASKLGFGGFDIYEVKPNKDTYYNVLLEIIQELNKAEIIDFTIIERMSTKYSTSKVRNPLLQTIPNKINRNESGNSNPDSNPDSNPENLWYTCFRGICKFFGKGKYKTTRNKKFIKNRKVRQYTHKKQKRTTRKNK